MNTEKLSMAMSEIDSKYITEALNYERPPKTYRAIGWRAFAASIMIITAAAFAALPNRMTGGNIESSAIINNSSEQGTLLTGSSNAIMPYDGSIITDSESTVTVCTVTVSQVTAASSEQSDSAALHFTESSESVSSSEPSCSSQSASSSAVSSEAAVENDQIKVDMSLIQINKLQAASSDKAMWNFDTEKYCYKSWNEDDIREYYGRDITLPYVPDGLYPNKRNGTSSPLYEKTGKIVLDGVGVSFFHDYYEDGSPKLTDNVAACKGISLSATKIGFSSDCLYLYDDVASSDIYGTEVIFGQCSMPYGPYDKNTHSPSGYYDIYTAEFTLDDINYKVETTQLSFEEIVKAVTSVICDNANVTVDKVISKSE